MRRVRRAQRLAPEIIDLSFVPRIGRRSLM